MTSDRASSNASASAQSIENTRRFHLWMDAFRTIAAVMVLINHTRDIVLQDYGGVAWTMPVYFATSLGHTGVVLFFVMSGFWISASVESRISHKSFWSEYLIARLSRLWAVLLPALLLGGLLDFLGDQILHLPAYRNLIGSHSLAGDVSARLNLPVFLANAFFLQTIVAPVWGSNGPLWSLAAEFWYYLFFPTIMILLSRKRKIPWLVLLAGVAVSLASPPILIGFVVWLLGYVLQVIKRKYGNLEHVFGSSLALSGSLLMLMAAFALNSALKESVPDIVMGIVFSAFLIALRAFAAPFPKALEWVALYGRKSSFSLYAIHFPIVLLVGGIAVGNARYPAGGLGIFILCAICAGCFVAAFVFSLVTEWKTNAVRGAMTAAYNNTLSAIRRK